MLKLSIPGRREGLRGSPEAANIAAASVAAAPRHGETEEVLWRQATILAPTSMLEYTFGAIDVPGAIALIVVSSNSKFDGFGWTLLRLSEDLARLSQAGEEISCIDFDRVFVDVHL